MKTKKITAVCPAGLGNRIKCLISTIKRCHELSCGDIKPQACIYWPINKECGCKFKKLLKPSSSITEIYRSELYTIEVDAYSHDAEINKSWKFKGTNNKPLDFQYHKLTQKDINEFLPYFKSINPAQDIQDTVWAFMNKHKKGFNKGEVVGVHIRKGDYNTLFDRRGNISTEDKFIEKIEHLLNINPNYKFLLCTEDEETEKRFKEIFGCNHIIHFEKRFRGRDSTNSVKEAFVDMLLLSKCNIILGTFISTFTELAWWFGECKAQVVIPGTEDKKAVEKVLSRLPQEGEGIHKKIWRWLNILWKEKLVL